LVIRHAAKVPIESGIPFSDVPLSKEGIRDSDKFGNQLKVLGIGLSNICSSPLPRCLETGNHIAKAHGSNIEIETKEFLAYPGSFLIDKTFTLSPSGPEGRFGFSADGQDIFERHLSEGVMNVLDIVLAQPACGMNISLTVTHDAIVAPIANYLTGERFELQGNWIDFLDGFALFRIGNRWKILMHGKEWEISPAFFQF